MRLTLYIITCLLLLAPTTRVIASMDTQSESIIMALTTDEAFKPLMQDPKFLEYLKAVASNIDAPTRFALQGQLTNRADNKGVVYQQLFASFSHYFDNPAFADRLLKVTMAGMAPPPPPKPLPAPSVATTTASMAGPSMLANKKKVNMTTTPSKLESSLKKVQDKVEIFSSVAIPGVNVLKTWQQAPQTILNLMLFNIRLKMYLPDVIWLIGQLELNYGQFSPETFSRMLMLEATYGPVTDAFMSTTDDYGVINELRKKHKNSQAYVKEAKICYLKEKFKDMPAKEIKTDIKSCLEIANASKQQELNEYKAYLGARYKWHLQLLNKQYIKKLPKTIATQDKAKLKGFEQQIMMIKQQLSKNEKALTAMESNNSNNVKIKDLDQQIMMIKQQLSKNEKVLNSGSSSSSLMYKLNKLEKDILKLKFDIKTHSSDTFVGKLAKRVKMLERKLDTSQN